MTLSLTKAKRSCFKNKIFHVKKMIPTFIGVCRSNGIIGIRWLKTRLRCRGPVSSVRNLSISRNLYSFKKLEMETTLYGFLVA